MLRNPEAETAECYEMIYKLGTYIFSSPEHVVLRMSYCDRSVSGVHLSVRVPVRPPANNYLENL